MSSTRVRVRRCEVTTDTWIKHRKLRKKVASAKWYATKRQSELRQQREHRSVLAADLQDLLNPDAPWNRIHSLYEWAHWSHPLRDYRQLLDVRQHPHAPYLMAIRSQIETETRPLMDSIWQHIPWDLPLFRERLVRLSWMQYLRHHPSGPPPLATVVPGGPATEVDAPLCAFAVPPSSSDSSSTSTGAWGSVWMASVPGVLFVALSLRYHPRRMHRLHPEFLQCWRWLAQSLHHIYHPSNPKDIAPHPLAVHPDANTNQPPNQTPIQKLAHIASQHASMLNPRAILRHWIQSQCFPVTLSDNWMTAPTIPQWWDPTDGSDSEDSNPLSPMSVALFTQPTSPVDVYETLWNDIRASDCESSISDTWLQASLDTEPAPHDYHRELLPGAVVPSDGSAHSEGASTGSHPSSVADPGEPTHSSQSTLSSYHATPGTDETSSPPPCPTHAHCWINHTGP